MDFLKGVGNFFRGVFGENDEEKRRRKEREAREAAQRRAAQSRNVQTKPRTENQSQQRQVQDVTQLFGNKNKPDPLNITKTPLFQQKPPTPKPTTPKPAPLPDQEFKDMRTVGTEKKKILGWDASSIIPGDRKYDYRNKVAVDQSFKTNKDKFVAGFDKLDDERKRIYLREITKQAKDGDQAAANSLKALSESNRAEVPRGVLQRGADLASVPGRSVMRVATGIPQGVSGLYDLASPGTGTSRTSKFLNELAQNQDKSAEEAGVGTAYKVMNIPTEIASFFIPSTLAVKIAGKFPKGQKLTSDIIEKVASNVDDAGEAGKVRTFLANRMRQNYTLDEALEEALISGRYIGQNAARGNDTSPGSVALDVAAGVGGGLLFPGRKLKRALDDGNVVDELLGGTVSAAASTADNRLTQAARQADNAVPEAPKLNPDEAIEAVEEKGVRNATEAELEAIANDPDRPSIQSKYARDELARRAEAAEQAAKTPTPDKPAFEHKRDIEKVLRDVDEDLNNYINSNPDLTPQQIEAAQKAAQERALKLIEDLQKGRQAAMDAVIAQGEQVTGEAAKQADVNAQVAADAAARTTPNPANIVEGTAPATSPEVQANDAYRPTTEEEVFGNTGTPDTRNGLNLWQKLSPDRLIRENVTRPVENAVNAAVSAAQTSDSKVARGIGRFFTGFSREAGVTPELQNAKMNLRGGAETGKLYREAIADLSKDMQPESKEKIWATLDPEQAARKGINPEEVQLNPEETVLRDKLKNIIDNTTAENLRRGLVTPEQAASESYIKRSYSIFDGNPPATDFERGFRSELLNQYKGRKQVSDEMVETAITDPTYLVGKKTAESEAIWAMQDYGNFLVKNGDASPTPKPGYVQLPDTAIFGEAKGKWVPQSISEDFTGFQYNNAMVSAISDVLNTYDRWNVRQAKKQILTIFNPAVRLGNQTTNRVVFSQINGINPVQFNIEMQRAKNMIKNNDPLYREAVAQGLTGIDISQADFYANRISKAAQGDKNIVKKALDYAKTTYSGADDQARIAAYSIHRKRGYSAEEAARMTQRGFQDYKSVGFFYDMAAKTPFIGNAFVRFAADSVRIAKNAAVDHPLRAMATVGTWSAFTNLMSVASGESEVKGDNVVEQGKNLVTGESKSDEQREREARFGSPEIPFTDISAAVQTPWGEVNAARFMPWYQLNKINDKELSKFMPIQESPVRLGEDGMPEVNPAGFQDPLLGQAVQLANDEDFRGKSITDPKNNIKGDKFIHDPITDEEKTKNALRWLFTGNAPLGRETDAILSATGTEVLGGIAGSPNEEREDIYGKDRSLMQSLLRAGGLKVEQQGEEQRKKREGTTKFFEDMEQIDKEVEGLDPASQEAYRRLTGYHKMRELVDNEFSPGDKRNKKAEVYGFGEDKWKEFAAHPELYDLMVRKKQREATVPNEKGVLKPLQPEFDERLSEGFRKQLIQNKMVAPGDDAELDQRMIADPQFDYYQELRKQYKDKAAKYYPESDSDNFDDETVKHQNAKFPDKPDVLKQYGAQYGQWKDGKTPNKPEWTDAHTKAKEQFNKLTFDWTNKERKARELDPIDWEMWNNPTFGYDSTPSSGGFGFGFGGGGRKAPEPYGNLMGELTNFSNSVDRIDPIEAAAMPDLIRMFRTLQAGKGGGKTKPKLGASARGQ